MGLSQNDKDFISTKPTKKKLLEYLKENYSESSGITKYYSIRNEMGKKWITPKKFIKARKTETKTRQEKPRDLITISKKEYEGLYDTFWPVENEKTNRLLFKKIARLQYVSGRRFIEIMKSEFKIDGDKLMYIPFKKKDNKFEELHQILKITKQRFIDEIGSIRRLMFGKKIDTVKREYNRWLKTFGFSSHKFRGFYQYYLIEFVLDRVNQSNKTSLRMKHLNHSSAGSTIQYDRYKVTTGDEDVAVEALIELSQQ